MTTATAKTCASFGSNRLQQWLLAWYALLWVVTAIAPVDRQDWAMENVLPVALVALLIATYRTFPLSDLSYLLIAAFLTLHAIGAHYSYARVPFGFWLQSAMHLHRNDFDRITHFSFGLLMAYPFREVFLRVARIRGFWIYYFSVDAILASSALYEILESWVAQIVNPALGAIYLGSQGDIWDAQNDMACALAGGVLSMVITAAMRRRSSATALIPAPKEISIFTDTLDVVELKNGKQPANTRQVR